MQEIRFVRPTRLDMRHIAVLLVALSLVGCTGSNVRSVLGLNKRSPDEFAVVKRQPLIIPPGYDLRPPEPGAPSATVASADSRARAAVTGGSLAAGASAIGATTTPSSAPVVIGSADGASTSVGSSPVRPAPADTSSPGQQALLAQAGTVPGSAIRDQLAVETEGRARIEPAMFERIVSQPATTGPGTPEVISRQQTPIDIPE